MVLLLCLDSIRMFHSKNCREIFFSLVLVTGKSCCLLGCVCVTLTSVAPGLVVDDNVNGLDR